MPLRRLIHAILSLGMLAGAFAATAQSTSVVPAGEAGFSQERLERIDAFYRQKVERGEMAGIVLLIARHGKIVHFSALGQADRAAKRPMTTDSIFRYYSMTKPIAAVALMILHEEGRFQLDEPISKYIPELKGLRVLRAPDSPIGDSVAALREPTIHDLFRHTAGFRHDGRIYGDAGVLRRDITLEEMMRRLASVPLRYQPGTKWEYSIAPDVQARLVEILSGMSFDRFLRQRLFEPLGMKDSVYRIDPARSSRLVSTHWWKGDRLVPCDAAHGCTRFGEYIPMETQFLGFARDYPHKGGSYGLFGTAEDYWRFAQMLANGGVFDGKRILSPATVAFMTRDHLGDTEILQPNSAFPRGMGWGLGVSMVRDAAQVGYPVSDGSYAWHGAGGTTFWVDPKEGIVAIAMTDSFSPHYNLDSLIPEIHALVYGALTR